MIRFEDLLAEALKDPEVKAEYDALTPEYEALKASLEEEDRRRAARANKSKNRRSSAANNN